MPIHIDAPVPGVVFDPRGFRVRGWMWLESTHEQIAGVEARDGETLLGTIDVAAFHERSDVTARYALPGGTRTGFEFSAQHPTALPREPFTLQIHARLRDGSRTPALFTRLLAIPPPERHPFQLLCASVAPEARGLEIGAHARPVGELTPFYTDIVVNFAGTAGHLDFLSDARALPIADDTLDYVCSSHVLEHLADPIAALHEWHRVLRPGGLLYLVVPDKRFTFDEPRAVTTVEHLLRDFREGTTAADAAAHVDEFVFQTNWSMLRPDAPAADHAQQRAAARAFYLSQLEQDQPIDIHFHTFTPESLDELLHAAGFLGSAARRFERLAHADRYPPGRDDGIGLLLRKTGTAVAARSDSGTFALTRGTITLPLVCPISLSPLRLEQGTGERALVAAKSGLRYGFADGRPALLPPRGTAPSRPWGDRGWRAAKPPVVLSGDLSTKTIIRCHLDDPAPGSAVDPLCFFLRGWVWLDALHDQLVAVEAWSGETLLGETHSLYDRPDVTVAHWLPEGTRTGYDFFAHHATTTPNSDFAIEMRARLADGSRTEVFFRTTVRAIGRDYRTNHFGVLLDQRTTAVQRHGNIFAVGPSENVADNDLAQLIRRYLGPPPLRVIDVGCGLGSYGRGLLADGYDWLGAEVNPANCAEMSRLGLPHWQVDGRTLPFNDASFDAAMCIEVLEHIDEPRAFLAEVRRVAPRRVIVSVPNCELLGYLWDYRATPWHMLEATHVNFFTRWSLGALLREFYANVEVRFHTPYPLRTLEGTPLHYNLLAIATNPP